MTNGVAARQIWLLLGVNDIRARYNRSKFGQFWITLSMGVFIGGLGVVYSTLFNQPMNEYLPYLAVNITIWTLIQSTVGEASGVFTQAAIYMRQDALPKTIFVIRLVVRNLIVLAHNIVIVPITFLVFLYPVSPVILSAIPGLVILVVALFLITLLLGILATRFRDLPQIIANVMQLLFFVTPVMWRVDQMSADRQQIVLFNPFASLLRIVAEPILGRTAPQSAYVMALAFILVLALLTFPLFARFRARIVYWL